MRPAAMILAAIAGCTALSRPSATRVPTPAHCVPVGRWVDPDTGAQVPHARIIEHAARADVVLLAEDHDSAEHHRWQLSVLSALLAARPSVVVGLEALPRSAQTTLDAWSAGRLDTPMLLERTAWRTFWGTEADQYLPIVQWARLHRQPVRALNVSRALVAQVGREGWSAVPDATREGVSAPAPASESYRRELAMVYAEHACRDSATVASSPGFTRFVEAQLTWDRAMAEALSDARRLHPGALVVGIMGRGHVEQGAGVPHQLRALGIDAVVSLLPWDQERSCQEFVPGIADAAFGLASPSDERAAMDRMRAARRPPCPRD